MHKQELNLKYKIKKYKKNKQLFNKVNFFNKTLLKLTQIKNLVNCYKINIRATSNNVFCTLSDIERKKTLLLGYSGKYNIKTSKRSLKFSSKYIIESFLKEINKKFNLNNELFINLILPKRIKKKTIKIIKSFYKKKKVILNVKGKKCFNGCKPKKKKRKKRKGFSIFK
jgi:ribosomal protein S11